MLPQTRVCPSKCEAAWGEPACKHRGCVMTYSTSLHSRGLVSFALNEIKFTFTREDSPWFGVAVGLGGIG